MKRIQTTVCFVFSLFAGLGLAQDMERNKIILSLPQAVEQALANHPAVQIQQYAVEQAEGQRTTIGLLPNPVVTFYREDLSLNGQDGGETTLFAGLPLNFLWSRWSRVSAASAQVAAEQFTQANVQRLLKFDVQKAFAETHFAARKFEAWQKAVEVFHQAAEASRVRFADGDMAGYEHQRIMVEHLRYQKAETEARIRLNNSQRRLAFLLNPGQSEALIQTSAIFPSYLPDISAEKLLATSLQSRPDLQAAQSTMKSKQAALTASKWGRLPEITAAAGYKKQVDDFKGAVLQFSLDFPLFNRNQGDIRRANAALNQQMLTTELQEKRVTLEVRQAYETYQLYLQQVRQFTDESIQPPEQLLEIAQFSYAEGEMSLLELLDGVRAYSESFQTKNDLLLKYELSIFALEKATGMSLSNL